jgi:hypothetical protein
VEIVNINLNSIPLSTSYEGDEDLFFISRKDITEEGLGFFKENYLKNVSDSKINNYSSLILSKKQKISDVLDLKRLDLKKPSQVFNTSIVDNNTNLYLTVTSSNVNALDYYFSEKDQKFINSYDRIFEINLLDETNLIISHKARDRNIYYLNYNSINLNFTPVSSLQTSVFKYILDKKNNKLALFHKSEIETVLISTSALAFSTSNLLNSFTANCFNVNFYIQNLEPKINTSWISYDFNNKNQYQIVNERSRSNLENNILVSTQYSYVTSNEVKANFLNLKNQKTHKNYSHRSDYLEKRNDQIPVVDNREYYGLNSGNEQEKGDYSITLNYEFYNADYKMESDKYTVFFTPESLYPYEQININDLEWNKRGAIAGDTPYTSDKIFQRQNPNQAGNAEYLCSWLHKNRRGETIWLDRYYYPEKTSYSKALESSFSYSYEDPVYRILETKLLSSEYYDVPFVYNSLAEEFLNTPQSIKSALYGINFFDKRSDLVIKPNTEYIYHRIGNTYVKNILESIQDSLIQNGLELKTYFNSDIFYEGEVDDIEYIFDNNSYMRIENYEGINDENQFTLSFWMKSDNWSKGFGHQILGNLNDKGFSLLNDQKITPLIMVQNKNNINVYNTNFELVDQTVIKGKNNEDIENIAIKDIYRTEHLNYYSPIIIQ